ncbi:MAG TPA: chorismate synthase [Tepidisphaeraceae bacterium]
MATLSYRTAGESHGKALIALIEGMPRGVTIDHDLINAELARRQGGYGRGGRMKIETDKAEFLTGVRMGHTIASPITMLVPNKDYRLDDPTKTPPLTRPRPGHADLAGSMKWLTNDCRETLERASARETTMRVAAGALSRSLLKAFGIEVFGFVRQVGEARGKFEVNESNWRQLLATRESNDLYCPDPAAADDMRAFINSAKIAKDTAGGVVECHVFGCPVGLGSSMTGDGRLDGRIGGAVMSIQAFKGVEIGMGFETATLPGSKVHDEITYDPSMADRPHLGFVRPTNNAGGLEGGMTNGMPVVVRGAMKPISTLGKPLRSIDLATKQESEAGWERSDISAISAASVILENVVAFEIARALIEKFGGDSLVEMKQNYDAYLKAARELAVAQP